MRRRVRDSAFEPSIVSRERVKIALIARGSNLAPWLVSNCRTGIGVPCWTKPTLPAAATTPGTVIEAARPRSSARAAFRSCAPALRPLADDLGQRLLALLMVERLLFAQPA